MDKKFKLPSFLRDRSNIPCLLGLVLFLAGSAYGLDSVLHLRDLAASFFNTLFAEGVLHFAGYFLLPTVAGILALRFLAKKLYPVLKDRGAFVLMRRFRAIAEPFWVADGAKGVMALIALVVFVFDSYFGLAWAVQQTDAVTQWIVGSLSQGYEHFALFYALPAVAGSTALYFAGKKLWPKSQSASGIILMGALLLLMLAVNSLNVILNFANGAIMNAMNHHDHPLFNVMVIRLMACFVVGTFIVVLYSYVRSKLALTWRTWLTSHILDRYFQNRNYYKINQMAHIDNPDERIAVDVDGFVSGALSLLLSVLGSIITYFTFIGILKEVDPTHSLTTISYLWSFGFTIIALFFGKKLVGLNFMQSRREADFRYNLIHVRNNTESIAFYQGEEREQGQVRLRFREVIRNWDQLIGWTRNLGFVQTGSDYFTVAIPFLVLGALYFDGKVELGTISQASMAFGQVLSALTIVVAEFRSISLFTANINRLSTFTEALDEDFVKEGQTTINRVEDGRLAMDNVTLMTPGGERMLVKDLNFEVKPGEGLVIMGPSGSGKSSLLRAEAGLWHAGSGTIHHPSMGDTLFLPQRPYMILGSLRDQLLYPHVSTDVTDEQLQAVLNAVNLPDLAKRVGGFNTVLSFADVLSLGEQQRVAFARLLLAKPKCAILDEGTSALDEDNEEHLYRMLQASGTTYISVGHRPSLRKYHHNVLRLTGDKGGWTISPTNGQ